MKRLSISICTLLLFCFCSAAFAQQQGKMKEGKTKMKDKAMSMDNPVYPYVATYSSNFVMGNTNYSKMVLELWKDWDNNDFAAHDYMADTIIMFFPDGTISQGKDSVLAGAKRVRGSMSGAVSTLQAWVPLKSVDRDEDWVALWGEETDTWADGKKETRDVQEIWKFNKEGKIALMRQYYTKPSQQ